MKREQKWYSYGSKCTEKSNICVSVFNSSEKFEWCRHENFIKEHKLYFLFTNSFSIIGSKHCEYPSLMCFSGMAPYNVHV